MDWMQKYNSIPVLIIEERPIRTDIEKAEVLTQRFVKVHSNSNISDAEEHLKQNPDVKEQERRPSGCTLHIHFTIKEGSQTSPGNDEICNEMINLLPLNVILFLFNKVWERAWKHGIIAVAKPGIAHMHPTIGPLL